jgi:hypothetical protein
MYSEYGKDLGMAEVWRFIHSVEELLFVSVLSERLYIGYLWVW